MDNKLRTNGATHNVLTRAYDLPDAILLMPSAESAQCMVWRPADIMIVIGKGSDPTREVDVEAAMLDGVPILRRGTGGCAVVLSPEMLVASFVIRHAKQLQSKEYFRLFNSLIVSALSRQGMEHLEYTGTSDIAIHGRKIAGTAIYRNRDVVFFHAIINVAGGTNAMERYLRVPPRMPKYRNGRSHAEFVSSLAEHGYIFDEPRFARDLQMDFSHAMQDLLTATATGDNA